jgi:hypothetical protein
VPRFEVDQRIVGLIRDEQSSGRMTENGGGKTYVKLDSYIVDHRVNRSTAGVYRNRGRSGWNRKNTLRRVPGVIRDFALFRTTQCLKAGERDGRYLGCAFGRPRFVVFRDVADRLSSRHCRFLLGELLDEHFRLSAACIVFLTAGGGQIVRGALRKTGL